MCAFYNPPTEDLPIFDVTVFKDDAPYGDIYLARKGLATSVASETTFTGLVSFNSLTSPPHCAAVPVNPNDIANKAYVDALAPQTSYIVFLNYSQTFTTSTPTIYKKLNPLTNNTPTLVPFHTVNITPLLIAGFFNTKADLKFANTIPAGLWNLILYANCAAIHDQNHLGLNFVLIGVTSLGVETIIETSAYSPLINVLSPLIGTYSCILTVTTALDITPYDQIGIKVYALSNTSAGRDGSIFFQYPSYYSALQTSYATTQAADLTTTNNTWTGTNTFQNTTNLNTTIIQGTGTIQFPDASIQSTAFKSITSGIYTNSNITVDAQGAISAISTGVGGSNAQTIDLTLTASGIGYNIPYSSTTGLSSTLLSGGLVYNRDTNTLAVSVTNSTNATNLIGGTAGKIPYQTGASATSFTAVGTANQVLISNGVGAPSWSTNLVGNAGSSTAIALTGDDTSGDWFIPYSKTTSATSNALYIDNTTTPLTYNANLGRMSASAYTVGNKTQTAGTNSALIRQTTANLDYINNATSGTHKFTVYNATPTAVVPLTIGSTTNTSTVPLTLNTTIAVNDPSLTLKDTSTVKSTWFIQNATGGAYNSITQAGDQMIFANGTDNVEALCLTVRGLITAGLRLSSDVVLLGSGGTSSFLPTTNINMSGNLGTIAHTSTTCPTQAGYGTVAGTDSTTKIATTAWVQSAIPLGTSALATGVVGGVIGNVLYQASAGVTTKMVNGTVGTVLTSGGVGAVPTWSANLAGNAGSSTFASNTTITNDLASAASHALTFVSNITGNLPQKTRANVSTGDGLTYIPSSNILNVNIGGVGTVATAKIAFKTNLSELAEINNGGGVLSIINNDPSNQTLIQTADSGGVLGTRAAFLDTDTIIYNKLNTNAGIVGPTAGLTYTSNMIGYTVKVAGNGVAAAITTVVWGTVTTTGFTFPSLGVWLVSLSCFHNKNATAGNLIYQYIGLGTSATVVPAGAGTFSNVVNSTASQPAVNGFLIGETTKITVITQPIATVYYVVFMASFTGSVYTKNPTSSFYQLTRIA